MNEYRFFYEDGMCITHKLSDEQYGRVEGFIEAHADAVLLKDYGFISLKSLRAIIKQEPLAENERSYTPDLTDEEKDYLESLRLAEKLFSELPDDDEYEGGAVV